MMISLDQLTPQLAPTFAGVIIDLFGLDGVSLDYGPDSLAAVDDYLAKLHEDNETLESVGLQVVGCGCYVGEVFVRNLGAQWKVVSETAAVTGIPIVVVLPNGTVANPIGKAMKLVENGREDSTRALYLTIGAIDGGRIGL